MVRWILASLILVLAVVADARGADAPARKTRLLFLIAEGVNRHEFNVPYEVGRAVGYEFDLAGPAKENVVVGGKDGAPTGTVNLLLEQVKDISPYAGLIIPGGGSPGNLEKYPASLEICRKFVNEKVPVLGICHGPRLLIRAGVMRDRVGTSLTDSDNSPPYSAVLALREGFDGHAYAALRALLTASGRKAVVIGPRVGKLRGMNGIEVDVPHAYSTPPRIEAGSLVVAPGGLWPEKDPNARQAAQPPWIDQQAQRDAQRIEWLVSMHKAGAVLVVVGFDGFRLARDATFKGVEFAGSAQTGSKFGGLPGKLATQRVLKSADRLYSTQGPDSLGELLRLLEKEGLINNTAERKGK
ncbi:MAG: DJ-1/PfpI family protein [Thermoguttaceae bacterium]|jgi:protease I